MTLIWLELVMSTSPRVKENLGHISLSEMKRTDFGRIWWLRKKERDGGEGGREGGRKKEIKFSIKYKL